MTGNRSHAIVLGASMAGLGAARVLSNHFERVTVVERDVLPTQAAIESRKGVPQGNHGHGLLTTGYRVLEEYFPGIGDQLVAAGGKRGDLTGDFLWYQFGGFKLRRDSGLTSVIASRPCLEAVVRKRARELERVTLLEDHDAVEPVFTKERERVVGLRIKDRKSGEERTLDADLVIDTTGRGSLTPRWLAGWGYGEVPESAVKVDIGYATGNFPRKPEDLYGMVGGIIAGTPPTSKRGAGLFAVEGDRWVVTLGCWLKDYPPTDLAGFREFARSLPTPEVYDLVKDREPIGEIMQYRFPANRRRHFDKLPRFPSGYLVMGDAVCSFNPIYGQGMAVALSEAKVLDDCLAQGDDKLAQRFFQRAIRIVDGAWDIATGEDLRFPEVEGPRPPGSALIHRYMERAHKAAGKDPVVLRKFFEVVNLLSPPTAMLAPSIAWRVLLGGVGDERASIATKQEA